jgi:hypothetical protein
MRFFNKNIILKIIPVASFILFIWMLGSGLSLHVLLISCFLIFFPFIYIVAKAMIRKYLHPRQQ